MSPALRLYRALLRVLPQELAERAGAEMEQVFEARRRRARGVLRRLAATLYELAGVLYLAVGARVAARREARAPMRNPERRSGSMDGLVRDARYALRAVLRRPLVGVLAALTLGLGVAASTAMFSVVDAVLLRPLPWESPEDVVSVYTTNKEFEGHPTLGSAALRGSFSGPELRVLREEGDDVLDGLAMYFLASATIYGEDEPERVTLGRTTPDLFEKILRARTIAGRVIGAADAEADAKVLLLEEGYWRRRYGDPSVVGRTVRLGDTPYQVVGILAQATTLPVGADLWVLTKLDPGWNYHQRGAIGRLRHGVSPDLAKSRLTTLLAGALPPGHTHGVNVIPKRADDTRGVRGPLWLLGLASIVLLLVACGNVAALLIGAAIDREQEIAVRAALGAGRGRLVRQMLAESTLIGVAAAGIGLLLAFLVMRGLVLIAPTGMPPTGDALIAAPGVPHIGDATLDAQALGFAVAVAILGSVVFGLIPALVFSRTDLRRSMTVATRSVAGTRARVQGAVVVAEIALATVLLIGAGLLARTVVALNHLDTCFSTERTLAVRTSIPTSRLVAADVPDSVRAGVVDGFYSHLMEEMSAVPGVRGVAMTSNLPLSTDRGNNAVGLEGYEGEELIAERRFVSPTYFDVLGIRMVEGRSFTPEEDRPGMPGTVVISEGLARAGWPDRSAIGRHFQYWGRDNVVVGVAADVRDEELQTGTSHAFCAPRRQAGVLGGTFVLRTAGDPVKVVPALRARPAARRECRSRHHVGHAVVLPRLGADRERALPFTVDHGVRTARCAVLASRCLWRDRPQRRLEDAGDGHSRRARRRPGGHHPAGARAGRAAQRTGRAARPGRLVRNHAPDRRLSLGREADGPRDAARHRPVPRHRLHRGRAPAGVSRRARGSGEYATRVMRLLALHRCRSTGDLGSSPPHSAQVVASTFRRSATNRASSFRLLR